jgi:hypothetical protein
MLTASAPAGSRCLTPPRPATACPATPAAARTAAAPQPAPRRCAAACAGVAPRASKIVRPAPESHAVTRMVSQCHQGTPVEHKNSAATRQGWDVRVFVPRLDDAWLQSTQPSGMTVPLMPLGHAPPLDGVSRVLSRRYAGRAVLQPKLLERSILLITSLNNIRCVYTQRQGHAVTSLVGALLGTEVASY